MDTSKQKFISHFLFVGEQCGKAEEAITFSMSLFKNSRLLHIERWSEDEDKEEIDKARTVLILNSTSVIR